MPQYFYSLAKSSLFSHEFLQPRFITSEFLLDSLTATRLVVVLVDGHRLICDTSVSHGASFESAHGRVGSPHSTGRQQEIASSGSSQILNLRPPAVASGSMA